MPPLRDILDAATPAPWLHADGPDDDWGFVAIGESGGHGTYGFDASHDIPQAVNDARLIALAPELAALCLDMGEWISRDWDERACRDPECPCSAGQVSALLARLDRLGAA